MKTILSIISILLVSNFAFAQNTSFGFVDDKVQNVIPTCNGSESYKVHLLNLKSDSLALAWKGIYNTIDSCWLNQFSVCDNYNCYLDLPTQTKYFSKIGVGDTANIKFGNAGFTGFSGQPTIKILIWDVDAAQSIDTITYNVTIDCNGAPQCNALLSVGAEIKNAFSFSVYPNPASDKLIIDCNGMKATQIIIMNLEGKKIVSVPAYSEINQLNIKWLENGIYFLQVLNGNNLVTVKRFVKF